MREHFQLSEVQYKELSNKVTLENQIKNLGSFTLQGHIHTPSLSKVNILLFIDRHGTDFFYNPQTDSEHIAKAIFDSMESIDKLEIMEYIEWSEENG